MTLECIQSREGGDRGSQRGVNGGGTVDHLSDQNSHPMIAESINKRSKDSEDN